MALLFLCARIGNVKFKKNYHTKLPHKRSETPRGKLKVLIREVKMEKTDNTKCCEGLESRSLTCIL